MKKKLYRNTDEKLLGGVLAGFAEYQNTDVVMWRLGFIVVLLLTGLMPGVLIYLVAWVIIPQKPIIEPVDAADYTVYR
jgi:phage shock protein C